MEVFPGGHFYLNAQLEGVLTSVAARVRAWAP